MTLSKECNCTRTGWIVPEITAAVAKAGWRVRQIPVRDAGCDKADERRLASRTGYMRSHAS